MSIEPRSTDNTPQPRPWIVPLAVGDKIRFEGERQAYTVRAVTHDGVKVICTKPFNLRRTVLYCIVDFYRGVRGPDNRVFSRGYEDDAAIAENLSDIESGDLEVSHRREAALRIDTVNGQRSAYDHWGAPIREDRKRWQAEHEAAMAARSGRVS